MANEIELQESKRTLALNFLSGYLTTKHTIFDWPFGESWEAPEVTVAKIEKAKVAEEARKAVAPAAAEKTGTIFDDICFEPEAGPDEKTEF